MSGSQQGIPSRDRVLSGSVTQHGSQIFCNKSCRNMTFLVATGVLILYCDNVATKVFLSRPRQPRQEVRRRDRVLPWARNFMS